MDFAAAENWKPEIKIIASSATSRFRIDFRSFLPRDGQIWTFLGIIAFFRLLVLSGRNDSIQIVWFNLWIFQCGTQFFSEDEYRLKWQNFELMFAIEWNAQFVNGKWHYGGLNKTNHSPGCICLVRNLLIGIAAGTKYHSKSHEVPTSRGTQNAKKKTLFWCHFYICVGEWGRHIRFGCEYIF